MPIRIPIPTSIRRHPMLRRIKGLHSSPIMRLRMLGTILPRQDLIRCHPATVSLQEQSLIWILPLHTLRLIRDQMLLSHRSHLE